MTWNLTSSSTAEPHELGEVGGHVTLLEWLRGTGFTGCKEGCAEGECGACAVHGRPAGRRRIRSRWTAINACLVPAAGLDDQEVITAEGLGDAGPTCTRCSGRWPTAVGRNAATAHRVSSARWPRSTTARTAAGTPAPAAERAAETEPDTSGRAAERSLGATVPIRPRRVTHPTTSTARTASTCTRCPETCAAAPVTGRSGTRRTRWASRPSPTRCSPGWPGRRRRPRRPGSPATRARSPGPADLAEALDLLAENPTARVLAGSTDWGVELNIRHARAALTIGIDRLEELRQFAVGADTHRHRRRADPVGGRAAAGRAGTAAGRDVPAVRLPVDPQRRHLRRQPRHRFADRRHPAGAAGAGRRSGAGLPRRRARGAAERVLHRLPADAQAPGRTDQDDPHPDCRSRRSARSTRSPSAGSTTSPAWQSVSRCVWTQARTAMRRRRATSRSASAASRPPRCVRCAPRSSWPASPGPAT